MTVARSSALPGVTVLLFAFAVSGATATLPPQATESLVPVGTEIAQAQAVAEPIVYTVRVPDPTSRVVRIEAVVPTDGRADIELMMPLWSPGFYRVEDYAAKIRSMAARSPAGETLHVEQTRGNRWRVRTGRAPRVVLEYELLADRSSVTTSWVSPDLAVLNGAATFVTLVGGGARPHEVRLERPASWPAVATALPPAGDPDLDRFRAASYDELVDSPIVAGDLQTHGFTVQGVPHVLVDAGAPSGWDGARAAADLRKVVEQSLVLWGRLPYPRYVFLNVFRRGRGGLEHANSTLLTAGPRAATPEGYRSWLAFAAHEYVHAFNVKRLRPVELGPFGYEDPPRTPNLWFAEGVTSYYAELLLARAGLSSRDELLAAVSGAIRRLQASPGRHRQSVEQSSLEVWTNSTSGIGADSSTVSYYVKGEVVGFLLDARVRAATSGRRSLDDVMRLAYRRYGGDRGFTPAELRATAAEVAGVDLDAWFHRALATTEELEYDEALDWYGLRFDPPDSWTLRVRGDATDAQRRRLAALLASAAAVAGEGPRVEQRRRLNRSWGRDEPYAPIRSSPGTSSKPASKLRIRSTSRLRMTAMCSASRAPRLGSPSSTVFARSTSSRSTG